MFWCFSAAQHPVCPSCKTFHTDTTNKHSATTKMLCPGGCGPGSVCDSHRSICECPMTHTGKHCETPLLPACDIGDHFLFRYDHGCCAFHDGAWNQRWPPSGASTAIGPVPCDCLRQFVTAPFMLERTRLRYMRSFTPRCIDLPGGVSLEQFLAHPDGYRDRWRGFSLAAAHDALRLGARAQHAWCTTGRGRLRRGRAISSD